MRLCLFPQILAPAVLETQRRELPMMERSGFGLGWPAMALRKAMGHGATSAEPH